MRYLNFANAPVPNTSVATELVERLILAIDTSPSMEETDWAPTRLAAAQKAALALIAQKRRTAPLDEVGIVSYDWDATIECAPVTVGPHECNLKHALRRMKIGSATNISAALEEAKSLLLPGGVRTRLSQLVGRSIPPQTDRVHRVVLLTDGHTNHGPNPKQIATRMKRAGVCIDCIGIGGHPSAVDEGLLKVLASRDAQTGKPRYAFIADKDQLIAKFEELAGRVTR